LAHMSSAKTFTEREIFEYLFEIAKSSRDPEGVVAASLVRDGVVLAVKPSSDDSQFHAEFLVLKEIADTGRVIQPEDILYTTLEPCSDMPKINDGGDCVTCILEAGISRVIYAATDPEYSTKAAERLRSSGVEYRQIKDPEIIRRAGELFNSTINKDLSAMKLPRKSKI